MADSPVPATTPAGTTPGKSRKQKVDPNETDRQKFIRLAQLRTSNTIESIRKLALLGNKNQYEYSDDDLLKIETALTSAVSACMNAMRNGKPSQSSFTL